MRKILGFLASVLDPRVYLHFFRIAHYLNYTYVRELRQVKVGPGTGIAPNVSFRNGSRITIGKGSHISERCYIWAGDSSGRITIGDHVLMAPQVFITASNYGLKAGELMESQPKRELDVKIGNDVWLATGVVVTAGVEIGDGCVVAAGAVVTKNLPPNSIAGGIPAKVIGARPSE